MWNDEPEVDQIRENVKRRLRHRRSFVGVAILAIVVSTIVANVVAATGQHVAAFPAWLPGIIGAMIAVRILSSWFGSRRRQRRSAPDDDEIERAVRRELRRQGYMNDRTDVENDAYDDDLEKPKRGLEPDSSKRKNDTPVRLGDDGELIFDDEPTEESEMTSRNF